jgi:prolyl oligopeptidase
VRAWSDAQNIYARAYLDKLPGREAIRSRVKDLLGATVTTHFNLKAAGGQLFAMKRQPPKEQPFLVVMPSPDQPSKARILVDPTKINAKGTTAIDWFVPSPDGRLVAVSLSEAGSEAGDLHIIDAASGKEVYEVIPRVQNGTAGGDMAWSADGRGFFYTRYPRGRERPPEDLDFYQQLWYHQLGRAESQDRYEFGRELPRIAEIKVQMHDATGRMLVTAQNGDGGEFAHWLRTSDGKYRKIAGFKDHHIQGTFAPDGSILMISRKGAPRGQILKLGEDLSPDRAPVIVPQGNDTIVTSYWTKPTMVATKSRLFVTYQLGGPSEVRVFDLGGRPQQAPKQPPIATAGELTPLTGEDLIFGVESYVEPFTQNLFHAESGDVTKLPLTTNPPVTFSDVQVKREFAVSVDGTKVPVNIMIPRTAKLDGTDPCLATGYGGYGINIEPHVKLSNRVLFDQGFIVVVVNLRGGGEYGDEWHDSGKLTKKQNVFDDLTAALRYLVSRNYTSRDKLAIEGGSNGGLLMGAELTQHPELMKVVVSHVGIYDMLRVELSANGAFNVPEFGTVKNESQYRALRAYSPYHNVRDGTKYPAVLFLTGANDPRVDPMQSRKMTARLQAATSSEAPILLRTNASGGHGLDTALSERIEEQTDVFAFIFAQLGVKLRPAP